jgi:hypothetical protein
VDIFGDLEINSYMPKILCLLINKILSTKFRHIGCEGSKLEVTMLESYLELKPVSDPRSKLLGFHMSGPSGPLAPTH